jgi:hypothetical protein
MSPAFEAARRWTQQAHFCEQQMAQLQLIQCGVDGSLGQTAAGVYGTALGMSKSGGVLLRPRENVVERDSIREISITRQAPCFWLHPSDVRHP